MVQNIAALNEIDSIERGPEGLSMGPVIEGTYGPISKRSPKSILSCKRPAHNKLEGSSKSNQLLGPEDSPPVTETADTFSMQENFQNLEVSMPKAQNMQRTENLNHRNRGEVKGAKSRSTWSWKKAARRK